MSRFNIKRVITTELIILGVCLLAYVVRIASGQFDDRFNYILFVTSFIIISVTWEILRQVNAYLDKILPYEKGITKRVVVQFVSGALLVLPIRFLIYTFGEPHLPIKLDSLFLAATWILYILAAAIVNTIFITRFLISRWKDSIIQAERLEKEKSQVQFDNLKNQLNPHFLFNALTSLNSLIGENPELASKFLQHMSRVYRYVLQNKDRNFVTLATELDFISNYIFLMETRFANSLRININVPEDQRERAIVPVTLQILIENAVKHNVIDPDRPLVIDMYVSDDCFIVGNNLQLRKQVETSNKQGLGNLKSLYNFLTERPIEIEHTDQRFSVRIPLI